MLIFRIVPGSSILSMTRTGRERIPVSTGPQKEQTGQGSDSLARQLNISLLV